MPAKDQTDVLESPQPDVTAILLAQDQSQKREPAPTAYVDNGGSNDPPVGT